MTTPKPRGFAAMDPEKHREIARAGGRAAVEKGTRHSFTRETARVAGKLGACHDKTRMRMLGAMGAAERERRRAEKRDLSHDWPTTQQIGTPITGDDDGAR
jgi:general stress protein YciG